MYLNKHGLNHVCAQILSRLVCLVSLDVRRSNYSKRVSVERSPRCIPIYSSNFDFTNVRNIVFRYRPISSNFSRDHWRVDRFAAITVRRSRKKEGSAAMRTYGTGHMCGPRHEMKKPFIYVRFGCIRFHRIYRADD